MSKTPKKFLDQNGLEYLANKLNNYPTNELLGTVIDAIGDELDTKYDKTGGEIDGNVKINGNLTLNIEDEDYDSGIRTSTALNNNYGTILTLTGYADNTSYRPLIRNVADPVNNYDVANKNMLMNIILLLRFIISFF